MENIEEIMEINEINKEERGTDEAGFIVPELLLDKQFAINIKHILLSAVLTLVCACAIFFLADCFPGVGSEIFVWSDGAQGTGNFEWRKVLAGESTEYTFAA